MADNNNGEKTFTQEEVNRIVQERLAKERSKSPEFSPEDKAELERYRAAEKADAIGKRIDAALNGKKFINDYTRNGVLKDFEKALADPNNAEKGDVELLDALTKDIPGLFQSKYPRVEMGGFSSARAGEYTDPIGEAFKPRQNG